MSIATCPTFSKAEALTVLEKEWGITEILKPLDSYLDQNFLVRNSKGDKFVLKISNIETPESWLDLQTKVVEHLYADAIPKVILTKEGKQMILVAKHWWRVLNFLEGTMLSTVPFRSKYFLRNMGTFVGNLSKQLATFSHEAAERPIQWDLQQSASLLENWVTFVEDEKTKNSILNIMEGWKSKIPAISKVRKSVIHADLTRYNLLLDNSGEKIQGIIDFGDVCLSWTIGELAVMVLESAMTGSPTPFADAYEVIQSYHDVFPLTKGEIELLYSLIQLRSATIVSASARQLSMEPDNEYVQKQAIADREMFHQLSSEKEEFATALFLKACKMELEESSTIQHFLETTKIKSVFRNNEIPEIIDISPSSEIYNDGAWNNLEQCRNNIKNQLKNGFGRTIYKTSILKSFKSNPKENETIALGIYVFAPAETPIYAPIDLIFVNKIDDKCIFKIENFYLYLYGIETPLNQEATVKQGELLGTITNENVNSPFPSHVFVQMDGSGVAPQFCLPSETIGWEILCPNAYTFLGIESNLYYK